MKDLEKILRALANRRRLVILKLLKEKHEVSVSDIASHLRLSFRSTSRHLATLRIAGVVDREQKGLAVYYRISDDHHPVLKRILEYV